ncbi:MAG: hypothetical protein PHU46_12040 [Rhodocyclaceae bacterium]|nr:hypothetical protein [Rhodocyclaceae bacterium]
MAKSTEDCTMPALTPERLALLMEVNARIQAAPRGQQRATAEAEALRLDVKPCTLYRELKASGLSKARKERIDKGTCCVSRDEAFVVENLRRQARRANGKEMLCVELSTEIARENGLVKAERVDGDGEIKSVSTSTMRRAIKLHGLDRKTLEAPRPHVNMATPHPNHTWFLDASVCVVYYLDHGGLGVMEKDEFYKNKAEKWVERAKEMIVRYLAVDHYSGAVFVRYFLGSESAINLLDFIIEAVQDRKEPMHGVPFQIGLDPGAANKSQVVKNLAKRMEIKLVVHAPKAARASGSVETGQNIWERYFESRLFTQHITSLEQLNAYSDTVRRHFNATKKHTRHGHTRWAMWQTIRQEFLRLAPTPEMMRLLANSEPIERTVDDDMSISFAIKGYGSNTYSVAHVPGLNVRDKVKVAINPYRIPSVLIVEEDGQGGEVHYECDPIQKDGAGFPLGAPIPGVSYAGLADTPAVKTAKAMDMAAYGSDTKLGVDKARRDRKPAFEGLDTIGYLEKATLPSYMARPGVESSIQAAKFQEQDMTTMEAAKRLADMGIDAPYLWLMNNRPDGVKESELEGIAAQIKNVPVLKVVGG